MKSIMQLNKKFIIHSFQHFTMIFSLFSSILLLIFSVNNGMGSILSKSTIENSSSPITIAGDSDLLGYPGNGTIGNPYIMQNLSINGNGENSCIDISGTTKYLIIENCTLLNSGYGYGISGIEILNCRNVVIRNCTFRDHSIGTRIRFSQQISIEKCLFEDCVSIACEISGTVDSFLNSSIFNDLRKGLYIDGDNISIINNNFTNIADEAIHSSGIRIIICNNTIRSARDGLIIGTSSESCISDNFFTDLTNCAIRVNVFADVTNATFLNNTFLNDNYGLISNDAGYLEILNNTFQYSTRSALVLYNTSRSIVKGNNFSFNRNYGVIIDSNSNNNTFSRNIFVCNGISHVDIYNSPVNQWNETSIGNYWDGYELRYPTASLVGNTWDEPYQVSSQNLDFFPQYLNTTPCFWLDFSIYQETCTFYICGSLGNGPVGIEWSVDGVEYSDLISISIPISPGTHQINVYIKDTDGEEGQAMLSILISSTLSNPFKDLYSELFIAFIILSISSVLSSVFYLIKKLWKTRRLA